MERVWNARPDASLIVAGQGPEANNVAELPRVELLAKYVPEKELDSLFARARIAVLPYTQASQSGSGSDALGRGVPTIVSNVGALGDLALDSSFLVEPFDEVGLAQSILGHLDDGEDVRRAVLAFARERLSWEACARRSLELYERVLSEDAG
jgi:glycosyltransferase involved in cell wall biosynthesis